MISSPNRSSRGSTPVIWVVLHTAEGAKTTAELGNYFAKASVQASSHVGIDDHGIEQYVPYSEAAWTIRGGNSRSDNAELCGFAAWTREQWLGEHMPMLRNAAAWVRERCLARSIPIVHLTPADVAAGRPGVIGHVDYTLGTRDGTHSDPGQNFPWDVVISLASPTPSPSPSVTTLEDDLMASIPITPDAGGKFQHACGVEVGGGSQVATRGWVTVGSTYGGTTFTVAVLSADAKVLGYWKDQRAGNNRSLAFQLPDGARAVTLEGIVDNSGTRPWVSTYLQR